MELNGRQIERLTQALQSAYPEESQLKQLVRYELDEKLQNIAKGTHSNLVFQVIAWAEEKSCESKLVRAAHRRNPSNAQMQGFCLSVADGLLKDAIAANSTTLSSEVVTTLVTTLRQDNIPFKEIETAGLAALPEGASDNPEDNDYADFKRSDLLSEMRLCGLLRLLLSKYPKTPDGESSLLSFARVLQEALGSGTSQTPLSDWLQQQTDVFSQALPTLPQRGHLNMFVGTLQVSLMVTVELSMESQPDSPRYLVQGYLCFDQLIDSAQPTPELPPLLSLSLSESAAQLGVDCSWAQVEPYTVQYFEEANNQLTRLKQELQFRRYELSVEVFLPLEKLGEPVDQWLRVSSRRQEPIGKDHGVIIRISDRLQDNVRLNALTECWERLQVLLAPPNTVTTLAGHVESVQDLTAYSSWRHFENALRKYLGLKLCCGLPSRSQERIELFEAFFYSDVPLAIWTRSCALIKHNDALPLDISVALTPFLEAEGIQDAAQLADKLTAVRQQAWAEVGNSKEGQCLGDHLAFLLDNPDRLPLLSQY
ncbi:MAG: effector-associated domain EAD1-containing protein [Cyanobacteria bacterium J06581_3]